MRKRDDWRRNWGWRGREIPPPPQPKVTPVFPKTPLTPDDFTQIYKELLEKGDEQTEEPESQSVCPECQQEQVIPDGDYLCSDCRADLDAEASGVTPTPLERATKRLRQSLEKHLAQLEDDLGFYNTIRDPEVRFAMIQAVEVEIAEVRKKLDELDQQRHTD